MAFVDASWLEMPANGGDHSGWWPGGIGPYAARYRAVWPNEWPNGRDAGPRHGSFARRHPHRADGRARSCPACARRKPTGVPSAAKLILAPAATGARSRRWATVGVADRSAPAAAACCHVLASRPRACPGGRVGPSRGGMQDGNRSPPTSRGCRQTRRALPAGPSITDHSRAGGWIGGPGRAEGAAAAIREEGRSGHDTASGFGRGSPAPGPKSVSAAGPA